MVASAPECPAYQTKAIRSNVHDKHGPIGKPIWRPWGQGGEKAVPSMDALAVCRRLLAAPALPPAFVVDVGLIEGRGWAVVELNPAWCSGLLGAGPAAVLGVLERACRDAGALDAADAAWLVDRGGA
jgi:ATP-grasp domain, R2K clade family 3